MSKTKIVFVSHCIFNTASKVFYRNKKITNEELARKMFLNEAIEKNIQLIQLPCPELLMYGTNRWGHTKDQFDNPFFREKCKEILQPYIFQMKAYLSEDDKFDVLGIIGIEGSPSCGIKMAFCGSWGGELSNCDSIDKIIQSGNVKNEKGVFMEVLCELMKSENIYLPMWGLTHNVLSELLK